MSYLVLARKYRPRDFGALVGQEHVVQALANALTQQRLHHAYLFTGTRGVGKTTVSRILAKSINCTGPDGTGGITATPCGVCPACRDIDAGRYVDYVELDAASNRGVEEITRLLDQAVYKPVVGRFKVYMVDEVHMLSNHAFNAMLKTLEEPPEYLKFVLATTDPQKVPPTVLSRCLQFNLRPMAPQTVQTHLADVLAQEGIAAEPGALRLLSRAARGSMRDALSLTDQAIAFGGGTLAEDGVRQMLGAVDRGHAVRLVDALARRDGRALVEGVDALRALGLSAAGTLEELAALLQQMAVAQAVPDALDRQDVDTPDVLRLAGRMAPDETQLAYSIVLHGRAELALAPDEYAGLAMVLLRMLAFAPSGLAGPAGDEAGGTGKAGPGAAPAVVGAPAGEAAAASVVAPASAVASRPAVVTAPTAAPASSSSAASTSIAPAAMQDRTDDASPDTRRAAANPVPVAETSMPTAQTSVAVASSPIAVPAASGPSTGTSTSSDAGSVGAATETAGAGRATAMAPAAGAADAGRDATAALPPSSRVRATLAERAATAAHAAVMPPSRPAASRDAPAEAPPAVTMASAALRMSSPRPSAAAAAVADEPPPWLDAPWDLGEPDAAPRPSPAVARLAERMARGRATAGDPATGDARAGDAEADADADGASPSAPSADTARSPAAEAAAEPIRTPLGDRWNAAVRALVDAGKVTALARELALQSECIGLDEPQDAAGPTVWRLRVERESLRSPAQCERLRAALAADAAQGGDVRIDVELGTTGDTPARRAVAERARKQQAAEQSIRDDPMVVELMRQFPTARIVPGSVKPH